MLSAARLRSAAFCLFLTASSATLAGSGSGCVWKVVSPGGGILYLGGSWHALRSIDYPLPAPYNNAFDASGRLAFEVNPRDFQSGAKSVLRAGEYPRGDSLKNHVDPRTYDYVRRFFAIRKVPEQMFSRYRPWFLSLLLTTGSHGELSHDLGVEAFMERRAQANSKPIVGLESLREHMDVFSGLSDRASEAVLLITFIPADKSAAGFDAMMKAWRSGNVDFITNAVHAEFRDVPAMGERLLGSRNRRWIPKLERYLTSGQTYFAVVGAAHLGGSDGLLALLKARGYRVEQL